MAKVLKVRRGRQSGGANKSQAIRDTATELGGKPRPKDIIARLKEKGVEASPALVSNVLARARLRRRGRKLVRKLSRNGMVRGGSATHSQDPSMSALLKAKHLVSQVGSIDEAKRALDALAKLI